MEGPVRRYEMVDVRPGSIIVEHEVSSRSMRSYFSAHEIPPIEEFREGPRIWRFSGMAQSFHFDLLDRSTDEVTRFDDLLGLVPCTSCPPESDVYRLGEFAQEQRIWIYVAVSHRPIESGRMGPWIDKVKALNRYFSERLSTPNKKVLILPDFFGLHEEFNHGQIMVDSGLTSMDG